MELSTVPAPIGGLNARDGISAMPDNDAISLVNWIPDTYGCRARKGWKEWAINFPTADPIESVMGYFSAATQFPTGTFLKDPTVMPGKLFCANKNGIFDVTTRTSAPAATVQALSGTEHAGWFHTAMLANSAGSFLLAVSEVDGYFVYNGTAWAKITMGVGATQIAGVDPALFTHVAMWKKRAWFIERNSAKAWYLAADALYGTATAFDFGPLLTAGGHLAYIANWTIDAGEGMDDYLIIVGSNGDVLMYQGTDPASADTFANVGHWNCGQIPEGRRAYAQYGGDLVIVSTEGVVPISSITRGGSGLLQATNKEYSSKIRPLIGADLRASFTSFGWQLLLHPSERLMICSVPDYDEVKNAQYVMSTVNNQWCQFDNIPIYSMGSTGGYTFVGTRDGKVLLLFGSVFDNVTYAATTGSAIRGQVQWSYTFFGKPAAEKMIMMIRPSFLSVTVPGVIADVVMNYSTNPPTGTPTYLNQVDGQWGLNSWGDARWAGAPQPYNQWVGVGGIGFAASATMITSVVGDSTLTGLDYWYQVGGPL